MSDLSIDTRRCYLYLMVLFLFCTTAWADQDAVEPFEIGQQWVYQHEGPRPGSMEPNDIDGERIMHVIGVVEKPEGKQWIIEDRFTIDPNAIGRLYVNKDRLLTILEIENEKGEAINLRYDPPIPHQMTELNIGEEKTFETSLKMDSAKFALPSTTVIRRLDDETITTPAGEFVNCLHYQIKTKSTFNIKIAKIPFTEERERWYHPKVNGVVKEAYRKHPVKFLTWSREGYTATSVLTTFDKEEVPEDIRLAIQADNTNHNHRPSNQSQTKASSIPVIYVIFLGMVVVLMMGTAVVLAIGIYIFRKRKKV